MGLSLCCCFDVSTITKLVMLLFQLMVANSLYSSQPSCHDEDFSALLQFKQSISIDASASVYDGNYPKLLSWKLPAAGEHNNTSCCSWDGVECDEMSGHVIGLDLSSSQLYGSINSNSSLFRLIHLQSLNLADNNFNHSQIPSAISNFPRLTYLNLSASFFFGQIPSQIAHLSKLSSLDLSLSMIDKPSPSDSLLKLDASIMKSLVQNLTRLEKLHLSFIDISSTVPDTMANLSLLTSLVLRDCNLFGEFPARIFHLQNLEILSVRFNHDLTGCLPEFNQSSPLTLLKLAGTSFSGDLPYSLGNLHSLEKLDLGFCKFSQAPVPALLGNLRQLTYLDISGNKFHGPIPNSYANLTQLVTLRLWGSSLVGTIPSWIGNLSRLGYLDLGDNILNGSIPTSVSSLKNLQILEIQDNKLTGEVPSMFCNITSLILIDVSNNSLSGMLPPCLGDFSDNLRLLLLGSNSFHGLLPQTYTKKSNLRVIDVSRNQLQGKLPRSLENCGMLELLLLSNNNFSDVFPFWLGNLPQLKILAMRHNGFHGVIGEPEHGNNGFPDLRILDLSYNEFIGEILINHVFSETAIIMRSDIPVNQSTYMTTNFPIHVVNTMYVNYNKDYSLTITTKGVDRYWSRIQQAFAAIDLSSNKFEGRIDPLIGKLKGLRSFNISNNLINGSIPSSLGNIYLLESLDLSRNKLSGYIPQQLSQLTFLSEFDVSYNNLTGSIPQGSQLNTFNSTSYEGNTGLCGAPLPIKCGNPKAPQPPASTGEEDDDEDSGLVSGLDWIFVVSGFAGGAVVGVVLSEIFVTRRRQWFIKIAEKLRQI